VPLERPLSRLILCSFSLEHAISSRRYSVKFFIDTANLNEIREAAELGVLDGVTTNPSLVAKEGDVDFKEHVAAICAIVDGPVRRRSHVDGLRRNDA
jgi:hypothetical protein